MIWSAVVWAPAMAQLSVLAMVQEWALRLELAWELSRTLSAERGSAAGGQGGGS